MPLLAVGLRPIVAAEPGIHVRELAALGHEAFVVGNHFNVLGFHRVLNLETAFRTAALARIRFFNFYRRDNWFSNIFARLAFRRWLRNRKSPSWLLPRQRVLVINWALKLLEQNV